MNKIETYIDLYKNIEEDLSKKVLEIQDWIIEFIKTKRNIYFDYSMDDFINNYEENFEINDALTYIIEDLEKSISYIMNNMHTKILREDIVMPASKVKEINSKGIMWISRKEGETLKQKLATSRNMLAVKRRMSIDTGENRLFLAFLKLVREYLEARIDSDLPTNATNDKYRELLQKILIFLRQDDLKEIKRWGNTPPNNTLLSDQNYKKIWKAWSDLKYLDDIIKKDAENILEREKIKKFYEKILKNKEKYIFPQVPIEVEYENCIANLKNFQEDDDYFVIDDKSTPIFLKDIKENRKKLKKEGKKLEKKEFKYVSIDPFSLFPCFIDDSSSVLSLDKRLIYQIFDNNKEKKYYISCQNSEAIFFNEEIVTYSFLNILNDTEQDEKNKNEIEEKYKRVIANLKENLNSKIINFLIPDALNPFQIAKVNKVTKMGYRKVRTLPRSIAALHYWQQKEQNFVNDFNENDFVLVFDIIGDRLSYSLLRGIKNEDENLDIPKILWERYWTKSEKIEDVFVKKISEIFNIENNITEELLRLGNINDFKNLRIILKNKQIINFSEKLLTEVGNIKIDVSDIINKVLEIEKKKINNSKIHIILLNRNLISNSRFQYFDEKKLLIACDDYHTTIFKIKDESGKKIHLWRDYLPYLAIKRTLGIIDLVKGQNISPDYDKAQEIHIKQTFTLPKGKEKYKFTLIGEDVEQEIMYDAIIKHHAFPLKEDTECELKMEYTYGDSEPYKLTFVPILKKEFSEAVVEWRDKEYEYINLKYPEFPPKEDWNSPEIQKIVDDKGNLFSSLIDIVYLDISKIPSEQIKKTDKFVEILLRKEDINNYLFMPFNRLNGETNLLDKYDRIKVKFYPRDLNRNKNRELKDEEIEKRLEILKNSNLTFILSEKANENKYKYNISGNSWWLDKYGNYFSKSSLLINNSYQEILFSEKDFLFPEDFSTNLNEIYFSMSPKNNWAKNIELANKASGNFIAKNIIENFGIYRNPWMIAMLHILFKDGKNINDKKCSQEFRNYLDTIKNYILYLYEISIKTNNEVLEKDLFYILSLIAGGIEEEYVKISLNKEKISGKVGYALASLSDNYLKTLLDKIENSNTIDINKKLKIISRAIWREKNFIYKLEDKIVKKYLDHSIYLISKNRIEEYIFEYIYAVFRLRSLNDEKMCKKLSMRDKNIRNLYSMIENLIEKKVKLKTRIKFNKLDKKGYSQDIDDLLYAILVTIKGEEEDIIISRIEENDNDD